MALRSLFALFLLTPLVGCETAPSGPSSAPPLVERHWISPVRFHGIPILFETEPGVEEQIVLPGPEIDLIGVVGANQRGIEHRYGAFYIDKRRHELHPVGPIWVFLPVRAGKPWRRRFADLTLVWYGIPPHHAWEQRSDIKATWGIGRSTIELKESGRITYRYGEERQIFFTPCTLYLGAVGELLPGPLATAGASP